MKGNAMDVRDRRLIELLSDGATTQEVARKMGYSEGTVRVYLHNLYRRLGVRNRTEAVIWYLNRTRHAEAPPAASTPVASFPAEEAFGAVALREGLGNALGVMESFLGPYGRLWEVATRMKGGSFDDKMLARKGQMRLLWRALLQGDFAAAKRVHDQPAGQALAFESPSDGVLLAAMLVIGGYSIAADRYIAQLGRKSKGGAGIGARESAFLRSLRDALERGDVSAVNAIHRSAAEGAMSPLKHLAMVALFYTYQARNEPERASGTADAVWAEAEGARRQLEAMGVRPLSRDAVVPAPGRNAVRRTSAEREKAMAR